MNYFRSMSKCRVIVASVFLCFFILFPRTFYAQSKTPLYTGIIFNHLTTAQGLSDNYIYDLCVDKTGNLWICTGDGLNMFNGKTITKFFKQDYPQMENNIPRVILCD